MRRIWLPLLFTASSALGAQAPTIARHLTVGCESCDGPAQFGSILDVAVSSRGEVLVVNKEAPMLRRFDASGKSIWTGGPKGKGPGEFTWPDRFAFTPNGMIVIDGGNNRVTELTASGEVVGSTPLTSMLATSGVNPDGNVVMGFDDMGRSFRIMSKPLASADLRQVAKFPGSYESKAAAMAPDGGVAVILDIRKYHILRLDAQGNALAPIVRDIPQPRRTAVEEAEHQQRLSGELAQMSAIMKSQGKEGKLKAPAVPPEKRGLEPHFMTDGLRFDDLGRLWAETMRGDETKTVFDVFAPSGGYLGEVTVPMRITAFALGGRYLATGGENENGIPVVTVWTVK
jgi:hypothetical protein